MADFLIIAVIVLILGLAAGYVYKEKKSGKTRIGCPHSGKNSCGGKCSGCCGKK